MTVKTLDIKTQINVQKPISEVFEAIVDPDKLSVYFIGSSTGRMEEGKTLTWTFPEFDAKFAIRVDKIQKDKHISYYWDDTDGTKTHVEMNLTKRSDSDTHIEVLESSRENNEAGLKWLRGNTEGWANFLACLKAYLEYGINLRKGCFDTKHIAESFSEENTLKSGKK
jgi:uncharacterized protein YndB with AHSA1/START domain